MSSNIIHRGPDGLEQIAGMAAFVIAYSLGLGLVLSLVAWVVVVGVVLPQIRPGGPGRWTE